MIGSFVSRILLLAFGYAYPAYECYKTVELNKPEIEQLIFWCQYWILVALLTVLERFGDAVISWLPMYSEAKLAFFVYLWYPKTKGTTYIYETFFRPYIAKHEKDIDRNLLELRAHASDVMVLHWQKVARFGQTAIIDVLQYVSSQAPSHASRSHPVQPQQQQQTKQIHRAASIQTSRQSAAPHPPPQPATMPPATKIRRPLPTKANQVAPPVQLQEPKKTVVPASPAGELPTKANQVAASVQLQEPQKTVVPASPEGELPTSEEHAAMPDSEAAEPHTPESEEEEVPVDEAGDIAGDVDPPKPETPMGEAIRVTRNRLRKRAATTAATSATTSAAVSNGH